MSPPCYVGQYASMRIKSLISLSRGNYTAYDSVYCNTQLLIFRFSFSLLHLGRITKGCSNNLSVRFLDILIFINTTQLYSNLVIMKYYLSVPCVGCPFVSKDLMGQACLAMHCSTGLSLLVSVSTSSIHSLASISLLLILEDKGGPTPGH